MTARHASPGRDPVLIAMIAAAAVLAVIVGVLLTTWAHREIAVATLHCPAPDHAMWAPGIGQAVCGESQVIGVTGK